MDSTWLVLLSLALGLVIGAGLVWLLYAAASKGHRATEIASPTVPDGVDQILEALPTAGIVVDPSNNVVRASAGAYNLGLVWNAALSQPRLVELVDLVRRTGDPVDEDMELARSALGDATTVQLSVRVVRLGSRYILLLADDRTEAVRLEQVRRDFVANISHELKTPIGAISVLAEALESAADDEGQVRHFAHRLTGEAARLTRLTQDIIDLSRLQSAEIVPHAERVSIDHVVASAVDQNRVLAELRHIDLATGRHSHAVVFGDESLLITAVHNLISNAVKYSPDRARVGVGTRLHDGVVEISITDQGPGIPPEDLDRVFERFYRVDQARSRATGGTGLGLAIVKHAVQNHGGEVRVWSKPGRGSTFTIRLPEAEHLVPTQLEQGERTI
ncbi:cell wall metabolism sensor histidine kinase WalK [Humibacter sp. RRB41]|uniref:sensor histidine kinase n=1 Tax=Humibacter sp. RRB41 TaxID=2919946 RepID=UPI001FAA43C3|nr:ATP-binding protein [Humibacter sp. RRB41]